MIRLGGLLTVASIFVALALPAEARDIVYTAALNGQAPTSATGSHATATARMVVHVEAQTVDLSIDTTGLTIDNLWDNLVAAPMGPIHLHLYGSHDHSDASNVTLILPAPFGPAYVATPTGFTVRMTNYPYATGAAILNSHTSFGDFLTALEHGDVILNIHTDAFHQGEISGAMTRAP